MILKICFPTLMILWTLQIFLFFRTNYKKTGIIIWEFYVNTFSKISVVLYDWSHYQSWMFVGAKSECNNVCKHLGKRSPTVSFWVWSNSPKIWNKVSIWYQLPIKEAYCFILISHSLQDISNASHSYIISYISLSAVWTSSAVLVSEALDLYY